MMLSNRRLRMIIIIILLMIFCYFIGIYRPKAQVLSQSLGGSYQLTLGVNDTLRVTKNLTNFNEKGEGYIYFIMKTTPTGPNQNLSRYLTSVTIETNTNKRYACEVGSYNAYYDNNKSSTIMTVKCYGDFSASYPATIIVHDSGYDQILGTQGLYVDFSDYCTFVSSSDSDVIRALDNNTALIVQALQNSNQQITNIQNNTQNINDSINDSNIDDSSSSTSGFSNTTNSAMSNTPVSNLIALPITFLTGVNNAISGSCTNVNYIELFDYQLVLPCLNLSQRLGDVWVIIDTIVSCMLLFSIGKSLVSTFARLSDMDTNIMYECYANGKDHRGESF